MIYRGHTIKYGYICPPVPETLPGDDREGIRLYTLEELKEILNNRSMNITAAYGDYNTSVPASAGHIMQLVCSQKD